MRARNPHAESPRVPVAMLISPGLVGPKARPKVVVDGKQANIPVLKVARDGGTQQDRSAG